ncbi:unnamed protein product, partial [Schistocephalus solidus]|uniref:C2H2-type domain-containing protein n=1 Tax=Schistocephalus solidus TaxID=70667 RepID=A0A183SKJ0_SCHSO
MGLFRYMRTHDSGTHRNVNSTDTSRTPSTPDIPTSSTTTDDNDLVPPDLSWPHCAHNFKSSIDLVGHLRIHHTEIGEPYDMDAEDSCPLQDFHVQDPILPSALQYSAEAAEMEVIQFPGLVLVDGPGLRSVKECRQDD